jgi:hypothetical protein
MSDSQPCINTDRELWREVDGDYYAPSIFVTVGGGIGINVGGYVHVMPLRQWHALAEAARPIPRLKQPVDAERK